MDIQNWLYFGVEGIPKEKESRVDYTLVQQFIGLNENAYESIGINSGIYEGDIIEFIDGEKLAVEWNDDTCQFQYSDGSPINDGERYATYKKIIGNLYQNPELLNK